MLLCIHAGLYFTRARCLIGGVRRLLDQAPGAGAIEDGLLLPSVPGESEAAEAAAPLPGATLFVLIATVLVCVFLVRITVRKEKWKATRKKHPLRQDSGGFVLNTVQSEGAVCWPGREHR